MSATLMVIYLGVVPTALAFATWAYALNRTTASQVGVTTYIVPVLVVLMSWVFLTKTSRPLAYLGGALCLAGVAISRGRRRPVQAEPVADEPATESRPSRSPGDHSQITSLTEASRHASKLNKSKLYSIQ